MKHNKKISCNRYIYQITLLLLTTFSDQILQKKTAIRIVNGISAVQIVT